MALVVVALGIAIGWSWYAVFSPLFEDPRDWAAKDREYRQMVREVLAADPAGDAPVSSLPSWPPPMTDTQASLVSCAEGQVARAVRLSTLYHPISYPWGDVPDHLATSADLVVRCLREAGLDLQQMIHLDRLSHPERYPLHLWAQNRADTSIDHRRLPNLFSFMKRHVQPLSGLTDSPEKRATFLPGDLIFWALGQTSEFPGLVGLVTDRRDSGGLPLVVTLLPEDRQMSDHHLLNDWTIMAHFRILPDNLLERFLEGNPAASLVAPP